MGNHVKRDDATEAAVSVYTFGRIIEIIITLVARGRRRVATGGGRQGGGREGGLTGGGYDEPRNYRNAHIIIIVIIIMSRPCRFRSVHTLPLPAPPHHCLLFAVSAVTISKTHFPVTSSDQVSPRELHENK